MAHTMSGTTGFQAQAAISTASADALALLDHALPRIFGYILVRVGNDHALAEDLAQETMIAFAQAVKPGRLQIVDPMAWLFGTARNKVIDHYRRQQRSIPTDPWPETDIGDGTDRDIDRVLDADQLTRYLVALPAMQQTVLLLHYNDGLSVRELASEFDRSVHAIESLLARGRAALRHQIAAEGSRS